MATASVLSEAIKGKSKAEITQLSMADLEAMVGITEITPSRQKCLLLALTAYQKAVKA